MSWTQASLGWGSLILPAVVAAALALLLPYLLGRVLPHSMPGLASNLIVSAVLMILISAGYFGLSYLWRGVDAAQLTAPAGARHIILLALKSALFWGPLILLQLATQPQTWRPEV